MTLLLLTGRTGLDSVGAAERPATRGRPEWLPGLAAAAKKQPAHHDPAMLADRTQAREPDPGPAGTGNTCPWGVITSGSRVVGCADADLPLHRHRGLHRDAAAPGR